MEFRFSAILTVLSACFILTFGERLNKKIYYSLEGGAFCFRRLNGTHQAGCSSQDGGTVGVVHMVNNLSDAEWMVQKGTAGPYMVVVTTATFNSVIEILMSYPSNVAGVLLYENATTPASYFSQESQCPNEYASATGSTCPQTGPWNKGGTELIRRDVPFPIYFMPSSKTKEMEEIQQCFQRYNLDRGNQDGTPLCSIQLQSFMYAAVNSEVCMRRSLSATALLTNYKVCDTMGDQNVYYSLFPRGKETAATKKPVILVTARIDTASLFDGVAPGAASSVVGLVSFITAAATLSRMIPENDASLYKQNILWTLFNGEAFDYIGSQRVAYDISQGAWPSVSPLAPTDLQLHLELGQLGGALMQKADNAWPLFAYAADSEPKVQEFLVKLSPYTNKYNMSLVPKFTANLPPSSLHSFRRILSNVTESGQLPEILIVDHEETFTNKFYHSVMETQETIGFKYRNITIDNSGTFQSTAQLLASGNMTESDPQVKIARLATAVAGALYHQLTDKPYSGSDEASAHMVDEMLYCFLSNEQCRLLVAADYATTAADTSPTTSTTPPQMYVGVSTWLSKPAVFAGHLLALLAGTQLSANKTQCDAISDPNYSQYWLRGWNNSGICVQTTMNFSQAVSPAFTIPDYDYTSHTYSTWTESVWNTMWARVFVRASGAGARVAALTGAGATLVAALATFWLRKHAALVFRDASRVNGDSATGILRSVNC